MSNQGVKHCQANEVTDNKAENDVQCAREEHKDIASGRCRSLWETLKVSDDKVTHHSHQKDAFGLNVEVSFTPKRHRGDSRTGKLADCKAAGDPLRLAGGPGGLLLYWLQRYARGCQCGPWHTAGRLYSGNLAEQGSMTLLSITVDNCR